MNADRYLLTFVNANHNAGAPIPAPAETYASSERKSPAFTHYADAVWDTVADEQHPRSLRDRVLRLAAEGRQDKAAYLTRRPWTET